MLHVFAVFDAFFSKEKKSVQTFTIIVKISLTLLLMYGNARIDLFAVFCRNNQTNDCQLLNRDTTYNYLIILLTTTLYKPKNLL